MIKTPETLVYLDYNATAPLRPCAREAMEMYMGGAFNASSVHGLGRMASQGLHKARGEIAALAGAAENMVIFGSGATEANNTVLRHFLDQGLPVLTEAGAHASLRVTARRGQRHEFALLPDGRIDCEELQAKLTEGEKTNAPYALVSFMLINNETGVIQDAARISAIARARGAMVHIDAAQAAGRMPLSMMQLGADFMTLSSHKIGGPQGAGALVLGSCGVTPVLIEGGRQEKGARAGTENVAAIAGFGAAAREAIAGVQAYQALATLRDAMEAQMRAITPSVLIHGEHSPRAAGVSLLSLPGASSQTLMMALDLEGIAISNGSACSSGRIESSPVLAAMGVASDIAQGTLRVSMGWKTTAQDVQEFICAWEKVTSRLRSARSA